MNYVLNRVYRDAAGYFHDEHRCGWTRRRGAPVLPNTEHQITPKMASFLLYPGDYVIEERP